MCSYSWPHMDTGCFLLLFFQNKSENLQVLFFMLANYMHQTNHLHGISANILHTFFSTNANFISSSFRYMTY